MTQLNTDFSFFPSIQSTSGDDGGSKLEDNPVVYRPDLQDDGSESVDENLSIESVASSIEDRLRYTIPAAGCSHLTMPLSLLLVLLVAEGGYKPIFIVYQFRYLYLFLWP